MLCFCVLYLSVLYLVVCVVVVSDFIILPGYVDFTANDVVSFLISYYSVVATEIPFIYII